jgi:hypothetical protein
MRTPGHTPTHTGTDSTPRHAPISKRRYDREARVLGLRNETSFGKCLPICLRYRTHDRTPADDTPAYTVPTPPSQISMAWKRSMDSSRAGPEIQPRRLTREAHINS